MGYLANALNLPPLIFKFQYHPEILSEKRSFTYEESQDRGDWAFDKSKAAGVGKTGGAKQLAMAGGAYDDLLELGTLLTATQAQVAKAGKARTFALEFAIDTNGKPDEADVAVRGPAKPRDIELDLAVLRSFMNPSVELPQLFRKPAWKFPPTCQLKLGDIALECVMTDLNIKITRFAPDLTAARAEISLTLSEQPRSLSTVVDTITRNINAVRALGGGRLDKDDFLQQIPGFGLAQDVFDL
ncbi:hypothetical protein [Nocardia goodfellowii]|uniref:Uncharacterized protein n=1 Tax=Nocardia goodfellowii TaxID=882446 RepID=A0ABS4QPE4_9NOCA|nr:hypothetical protein [Nocardia goodfellowii]MBP2192968.1 hypothetical protein [Nocardia goodfellowii]